MHRRRTASRGEGEAYLTPRQTSELAGHWYSWFIAQHEADPGAANEWEAIADQYEAVCLRFEPRDQNTSALDLLHFMEQPRSPAARRTTNRTISALATLSASSMR